MPVTCITYECHGLKNKVPGNGKVERVPGNKSSRAISLRGAKVPGSARQGWARDVNGRDETETLASRDRDETETFGLTSRDETFKFRDETETRRLQVSRRDRDVEMHVVFNAVQVNVGLTTVATVTACPLVLGCIPDFCVFNSNDCVQTVLCHYSLEDETRTHQEMR